jgi:hypothetical protein
LTWARWLAVVSFLALVAASAVGCGEDEPSPLPTAPSNPADSTVPTRISLTASSRFDQQLDVNALVLSADGHGVPNIPVAFSIGVGTMTPQTISTDSSGTAHARAVSTSSTTIAATIGGGIVASVEVLASANVVSTMR